MNPTTEHHDPKGAQLCQTLVHLTLEQMIGQVKNEEPTFAELCNALHKCCQLKKAHTAAEKIRSTERIAIRRLDKTNSRPAATSEPRPSGSGQSDATNMPETKTIHPTTPQQPQSHEEFCQTLTEAAKDIWGIDISHFHKPKKKNDSPSQPPTTPPPGSPLRDPERLYDIPPQYRQGATPIKDSQQKYGQPKYTHNEWRKAMHQAIRANYGIYDDLPQNENQKTDPTKSNLPPKNQPKPPPGLPFGGPTKTTPPLESCQPRPPPPKSAQAHRPRYECPRALVNSTLSVNVASPTLVVSFGHGAMRHRQ